MRDQDEEDFRQSMRRLAATVCVISCQHQGVRYGMTVTSVTSLCFSPLSILACINRKASIIAPLRREGHYCINVLKTSQADISRRFSGTVPADERFLTGDWALRDGMPYLSDAQANLFCEIDRAFGYATHDIVIGRVTASLFAAEVAPLIYRDGDYAASAPIALQDAA
ncbi:flavin reductase family protein [Rhizobiaceae bacterium BDR2-2]|uniref:Flavin reductase family protein n=1 Tax=Ectorhizobium quercum TaxID=2965071 RepID=A0AAE3MZR8_9HYPH|nr:flavin reductase family protein [Ectorhizobium quercum]MCX8997461.1 flavin reductase family protein [Ectorhizobium quercum]